MGWSFGCAKASTRSWRTKSRRRSSRWQWETNFGGQVLHLLTDDRHDYNFVKSFRRSHHHSNDLDHTHRNSHHDYISTIWSPLILNQNRIQNQHQNILQLLYCSNTNSSVEPWQSKDCRDIILFIYTCVLLCRSAYYAGCKSYCKQTNRLLDICTFTIYNEISRFVYFGSVRSLWWIPSDLANPVNLGIE